jgi:SAM-dependent methyltransferase
LGNELVIPPAKVIWHDLECGAYREDLALWRTLAHRADGPILDLGAGTGRVSLDLARAGHVIIALDSDADLLHALRTRAQASGLAVETRLADARDFSIAEPVSLCLVPMQTVQLLSGSADRLALLRCAHRALMPGGRLALALADALEPFSVADGAPEPLPDVGEFDGTVYASRPLAIHARDDGFMLERRRETVTPAGELTTEPDLILLQAIDPSELEAEGRAAGFTVAPREQIATSAEYVGSVVVMLDA